MADIYEIDPPLQGDEVLQLQAFARTLNKTVRIPPADMAFREEMKDFLIKFGPTRAVSWGSLNEDVLPDNTPRSVLVETLRLKLALCAPSDSFIVVDPYLFPPTPDASYLADLLLLLQAPAERSTKLTIVTKASGNAGLRQSVVNAVQAFNANLTITVKHTNVFHDRFWIADDQRGIFVGTSLNGLGNRYALVDFLQEDDAREISAQVASLP